MITQIHKHITQFRLNGQQIRDEDLKSILTNVYNDFQKCGIINDVLTSDENLNAMHLFCKHMIDNQVYKNILHPQIINHEIFSLMGNTMLFILQNINKCTIKDNELINLNWNVFHDIALVLTSSLPLHQFEDEKLNKIIRKTFFNEKFLSSIKEYIESLLLNNNQNDQTKCRILNYVFENVYFHSKACKELLRSLLLDSVVQCLISKIYTDQIDKIDDISAEFLLFDCPYFVLSNFNDHHKEIANLLCQSLLKNYKNILSYQRNQKHKYFTSYLKLLNHCAMIESTRNMFTQYMPFIITDLCASIKDYLSLNDETATNCIKDEELVTTILTLLYNLTSNSTIQTIIKEHAPKPILLLLCDDEQQQITTNSTRQKSNTPKTIQFLARSLIALLTENIDELDQPNEITSLFITYLTEAVKNDSQMHAGVHASKLLTNIAEIAQNDQVKEQIVESGALRLLCDCVLLTPVAVVNEIQQPALYAIWTVSFNEKACFVLRADEKLLKQLQEMFRSDNFAIQKAADGILWRLINEEKFRAEQLSIQRILTYPNGKIQNTTDKDDSVWIKINHDGRQMVVLRDKLTKEQSEMIAIQKNEITNQQMKTSIPYKYDLMISYCHKNSDLCNIIYNCLLKLGKYKIWIDKEEMHGSMMERMAKAIEESHLMLVCMSSAYRSSQACQAECEYAFKRQHPVLFIKVEPNYKPSDWLDFFLGTKYYIDITKEDFLTKFKDIIKQISIKRHETPDYSLIDAIVTANVQTAVINALKTKGKTNCTIATESISVNSDKILSSDHIQQSTLLPSISNSNQVKNSIIISSASFRKVTRDTTNLEQKTCTTEPSLLSTSSNFIALSTCSTNSHTNLQQINSKQDTPISSSSVVLSFDEKTTSILDNQNIIKEECFTSEKNAKYYPSNVDCGNANDNQDSLNDFALKIPTPTIPNISDDEYGTDRSVTSCNPFRICLLFLRSRNYVSSNE